MTKSTAPPPPPAAKGKKKKPPHPSLSNSALPAQNRRVLAQHYRAKYGVK